MKTGYAGRSTKASREPTQVIRNLAGDTADPSEALAFAALEVAATLLRARRRAHVLLRVGPQPAHSRASLDGLARPRLGMSPIKYETYGQLSATEVLLFETLRVLVFQRCESVLDARHRRESGKNHGGVIQGPPPHAADWYRYF